MECRRESARAREGRGVEFIGVRYSAISMYCRMNVYVDRQHSCTVEKDITALRSCSPPNSPTHVCSHTHTHLPRLSASTIGMLCALFTGKAMGKWLIALPGCWVSPGKPLLLAARRLGLFRCQNVRLTLSSRTGSLGIKERASGDDVSGL